ncbi:MAG TPA: hypothetical protein VHT91_21090 [Kofleriaceae bacterium]|nr:hypothetical protein [Kofleriaceae bacterium]
MTSVKKQIVVETSQQRAFRTFTDGIDRWWPREHHIGASPLERVIVEPRAGGRWYSICRVVARWTIADWNEVLF